MEKIKMTLIDMVDHIVGENVSDLMLGDYAKDRGYMAPGKGQQMFEALPLEKQLSYLIAIRDSEVDVHLCSTQLGISEDELIGRINGVLLAYQVGMSGGKVMVG